MQSLRERIEMRVAPFDQNLLRHLYVCGSDGNGTIGHDPFNGLPGQGVHQPGLALCQLMSLGHGFLSPNLPRFLGVLAKQR